MNVSLILMSANIFQHIYCIRSYNSHLQIRKENSLWIVEFKASQVQCDRKMVSVKVEYRIE